MRRDIPSLFEKALRQHQAGLLADAERIYRQILSLDPNHPDSLHLLGMIAYQSGNSPSAFKLISQAIFFKPSEALYHSNLGVVLSSLGKLNEAVESYQRAVRLRPAYTEAHSNIGNVLVRLGKFDDALPHFEKVLALNPNHSDAHSNLGVALAEQGKLEEAIVHYERAINLKPDCAEAFSNLANAFQGLGKLKDAIALYERALQLKPDYLAALYNLGNTYQAQDQLDRAFECYDRALAFDRGYTFAIYGKALGQLLAGDFAAGWSNYESRWQTASHKPMRPYPQPRWQGEHLTSGHLLLWREQGVGDEIMFAGLFPDVLRSGNRCIVDCDPRLVPIFSRSFPAMRFLSGFDPAQHPDVAIAAHQPFGSLPGLFRKSIGAFGETTAPYLIADVPQRDRFRTRYACGKRLVGIAWHTRNRNTGRRRCIDLSLFKPLFDRSDIHWVSLQYGDHDEWEKAIAAARAPISIDRTVDQMSDMDAFAAQISALDLVITIDNSTAHLAGALGVPVWVLLPFSRDWRWLQERPDSPWYPSMRLFRQPEVGDWCSVIASVEQAIEALQPDRAWAQACPQSRAS